MLNFAKQNPVLFMHKIDGLTLKVEYENGLLIRASTRGNGDEGEVVTHNARAVEGIPMKIQYQKRLVVVGEAYITIPVFEQLKATLLDSSGNPYKNARNMAAGSIRCYDASVCAERGLVFSAFTVLEGLDEDSAIAASKAAKLKSLRQLGFTTCDYILVYQTLTEKTVTDTIREFKTSAELAGIPIDGIAVTYDDILYSRSLGRTGHHYKDSLAFKFEDALHETVLRSIEWNPSRSGELAPVAVFDTINIDGCDVSRASLHNITIIKELELMPNCRILISKRGQIIPHVEKNLDRGNFNSQSVIPAACPCCGQATRLMSRKVKNRLIETLHCDNTGCAAQGLRKFIHFVGEKAMDIEHLSEATLQKFVNNGWLHSLVDIYRLDEHKQDIVSMRGFGEKAWQRLWDAIQRSRKTTFERFVIAMDIPMIGRSASRELSAYFNGDIDAFKTAAITGFDFTQFKDFGDVLHSNIIAWFKKEENLYLWEELKNMVSFVNQQEQTTPATSGSQFSGKTIVVTGKLEHFTRNTINDTIVSLGAVAGSAVTKNTDYLIVGEKAGSKLNKARELGISVLTEREFLSMVESA